MDKPQTKTMTVEEFFRRYEGRPYELIRGVPVPMYTDDDGEPYEVAPTGGKHQLLVVEVSYYLRVYAQHTQRGIVLAGEGGFLIGPDTYRAFDVAYMAKERIPAEGIPTGYWQVAPNFVVEIVSPSNRAHELRLKVEEYMQAGVEIVWIVYPDSLLIDVYRPGQATVTLQCGDSFEGGDVMPDFQVSIDAIFAPLLT
ncbi:MAG: Uma2 family endonuclease [Anaerolineales bacterium]|nr:Uma2 family endonuclease [Anaerolineales bacterium]